MIDKINDFVIIYKLSQREAEIFGEILLGETTNASAIAKKYRISSSTVRIHCKNINTKLGTESKSDAMQKFVRFLKERY